MAEREKRDVLILDEETDTLMDLFDRIYEHGFETTGVSTRGEALRWVVREQPDLLIDHLHEDPEEMKVLEKVRKLSPGTHIILLGDPKARSSEIDQAIKDGNWDWVPEDSADSALIEALDRATAAGTVSCHAASSDAQKVNP